MRRALLTCPWCTWEQGVEGSTIEEAVERGQAAVRAHNAKAGHEVKPGVEPRVGYLRGRPLS